MVNFNPQEEMSLENLLAALQGGLDPNQGYGMLADIIAQQQARAQTRKQNMQAYAGALEGTASMYPDRRTAMTQVDAWDTANLVGPNQADTLRDTVRTLYPDGRGTPSPLFDMSNLPAVEAPEPYTPSGDVPSTTQMQEMEQMFNSGQIPEYYTEANDLTNPLDVKEQAMMVAQFLVEKGLPVDPQTIYSILGRTDETAQYVASFPQNAMDIANEAASYFQSKATLGSLSGAG